MVDIEKDKQVIVEDTPKLPAHVRKTLKRMAKDRIQIQKIWDKPLFPIRKANKKKNKS